MRQPQPSLPVCYGRRLTYIHLLSFPLRFSAFHLRLLRNDTEVRNLLSYPDQHIDSDCFFAELPLFSSSTAYLGYPAHYRRTHVELDIRRAEAISLFSGGDMHYEHVMPPLFLLSMLLGGSSTRSRFSGFRCPRPVFYFLFTCHTKSDSFSPWHISRRARLCTSSFSNERITGVDLFGRWKEKLAGFIAHRWRS